MSGVVHRGATSWIETMFASPWCIVLPPVYRYMERQYVDQFFETGALMLSSVAAFQKHPDEARGDAAEGSAMVVASDGAHMFGAYLLPTPAYILCGSTVLDKRLLKEFPGANACLEISDILGFANRVARRIGGFNAGTSGQCLYGGRTLLRHTQEDPFPLPENPSAGIHMESVVQAVAKHSSGEDFLLKDRKYAHQAEYRFIWHVEPPTSERLLIHCPDAIPFCRRVTDEELS